MDVDLGTALAIKAAGSIAGSVLALVFQPPKRMADFTTRGIFSLVCGVLFADVTHDYLKWVASWQMDLAAAALTSMLSWFIMGAVVRIIARWTPPKGE